MFMVHWTLLQRLRYHMNPRDNCDSVHEPYDSFDIWYSSYKALYIISIFEGNLLPVIDILQFQLKTSKTRFWCNDFQKRVQHS